MDKTKQQNPVLPSRVRLPINRCNLPADIIGGLTFQAHPYPLNIDGVAELHQEMYTLLRDTPEFDKRRQKFMDYMNVHFRLSDSEDVGYQRDSRLDRRRANYINVIKGWFFDANSIEGAVFKGWTESRFGLLTRYHKKLRLVGGDSEHDQFVEDRAKGLYNTNALEHQLDMLYSYTQYELAQDESTHWTLYRGVNRLDSLDTYQEEDNKRVVLLNNINSFSRCRERACEFGDHIIETEVPVSKIVYYSGLLPLRMQGESEVVVLGGLYRIKTA